jgi:glycosyltransferase involved in cell wall biosynthesis
MKILFLTHYFPPEGNAPASRTYDNCKRWVAAGHDVTVLTCAPNVPDGKVYEGYQNKLRQEEYVDGIRVIRVWTFIAANKGAVLRIMNYLSYFVSAFFTGLFLPRPDVLICTSPQFFCGLVGVIIGRLRCLPRVLEIRDIWPESIQVVGAMKKSFLTLLLERVELFMYRSANHVVTVGKGYRDKLLERGVPAEGIDVITNGADLEFYCPGDADRAFRNKYDLEDKFTVAYVGTIGMASGLEVALEASRKLIAEGDDSFRFLLVGDGAEREALQERAEAEDLKHVVFTGRLDKSFMPVLLRSVEGCFIHLRKSDLFKTVLPSKLFEAFAVGRPIILGVDGNARELMETAKAGIFIEPGNADALVDAVRQLRYNSTLRDQFSKNGLKYVTQNFNRDELANDYIAVLEGVIKGK